MNDYRTRFGTAESYRTRKCGRTIYRNGIHLTDPGPCEWSLREDGTCPNETSHIRSHAITGAPARLAAGQDKVQGPWTPVGSIVIDGITVVPGNRRGLVTVLPPGVPNDASEAYDQTWRARRRDMAADVAAADLAETYGRVTGSRSAHVTVEQVTYDGTGRHVELVGEGDWPPEPVGQDVGPDLDQVREVHRRSSLLRRNQVLREALSLT